MCARRFVRAALLVALGTTCSVPVRADGTVGRLIDVTKSSAQFSIAHIFVGRVVGTVPIVSGSATFPPGSVVPTGVTAVLNAAKLATDEPDRDTSLESPEYFDTLRFPTWTFISVKITATGAATFGMDGLLTIHGVAQPEHLDVTIAGDGGRPRYHAVGTVDRTHVWNEGFSARPGHREDRRGHPRHRASVRSTRAIRIGGICVIIAGLVPRSAVPPASDVV